MTFVSATLRTTRMRLASGLCAAALLAGCADGPRLPGFLGGDGEAAAPAGPSASVKLVERDVEAPEVFQAEESGLWDGRPSLGGVWVAHPEVAEPERVIIRNQKNGKFVIGALFRRERETPGPRLQVSSDAAAALGMLAGQPAPMQVTALRREEAPAISEESAATAETLDAPAEITEQTLDPVSTAEAALDAAEAGAAAGTAGTAAPAAAAAPQARPAPAPAPAAAAPAPRGSSLDKPYIQIGIFSVEQNARNTAEAMRQAGMVPTVRKQSSQGKTFWRVLVGPATSASERATLLKTIKGTGFTDAYAVTN